LLIMGSGTRESVTDRRTATLADTARIAGAVLAPAVAEGLILRRPAVTRYAARHDLDGRAVRTLQQLRAKYGRAPLRLRVPGRRVFIVLDPPDVDDILARTPDPFAPATKEKKASLRHFQPLGVLISTGPDRQRRRKANEAALDTGRLVHRDAKAFLEVIERETDPLTALLESGRILSWDPFAAAWWRIVRQIVFGRAARDDTEITRELALLRSHANWAYLRPRHRGHQRRFEAAIRRYTSDPDPHSLIGQVPEEPATQAPHWLFAYDAAGATVFRAMALLATHPAAAARAADAEYARACLLDTVRLYPTTLVILREAIRTTAVGAAEIPAGGTLIIHSGFFHREPANYPYANEFRPDAWLDGNAQPYPGVVPFSAGPAGCPGRDLVELTGAAAITALARPPLFLRAWTGPSLSPHRPLPAALDHFSLMFGR
jgi:cytochrome P450